METQAWQEHTNTHTHTDTHTHTHTQMPTCTESHASRQQAANQWRVWSSSRPPTSAMIRSVCLQQQHTNVHEINTHTHTCGTPPTPTPAVTTCQSHTHTHTHKKTHLYTRTQPMYTHRQWRVARAISDSVLERSEGCRGDTSLQRQLSHTRTHTQTHKPY